MAYANDYAKLEHEYVYGKMSVRKLCIKHGIKGFSSVAAYARGHDWYEKRAKVQDRVEDRTIAKVAERISDEQADLLFVVRDEMLTVVRAAIYKFAEDLKDPTYRINAKDLIDLMKQGLLLLGEPTERSEEKSLALTGDIGNFPPELLRELASAARDARTQRTVIGGTGESLPPRVETTRTN